MENKIEKRKRHKTKLKIYGWFDTSITRGESKEAHLALYFFFFLMNLQYKKIHIYKRIEVNEDKDKYGINTITINHLKDNYPKSYGNHPRLS